MSDKLPQPPQSDEVDLGQLFNAIGRLFERLFSFIGKIFRGLFSLIIYTLKPIVKNIKLVSIVLILASVAGYVSDKFKEPIYASEMLVRPNFDAKYQLVNSVDYFNALITTKDFNELAAIFAIDTSKVSKLKSFEIKVGPESQEELLISYDDYINSVEVVDTTFLTYLPYEDFIKSRTLLNSDIFSIEVTSEQKDIFPSLENGFVKILKNRHAKKLKEEADSTYLTRKLTYEKELQRIDTLQKVYIEVLKNDSSNNSVGITSGSFIPLTKEKTHTREYELMQEEIKIRNNLRFLEEDYIEENDFYQIVSGFDDLGTKVSGFTERRILAFPVLAMIILAAIFIMLKAFKFIRDYE
jgi:hypothetical protein